MLVFSIETLHHPFRHGQRVVMVHAGEQHDEHEGSEFIHFGGELPSPFRVSNQYQFGHRIIVGLDPEDGVFARVSFFNTFDFAVRWGPVVPGPRRYHVWDLDPTARVQKPGVDRIERNLADILECSPRALGDFAATSGEVYDKVQAGHNRILGPARAKDRPRARRAPKPATVATVDGSGEPAT